MEPGRGSAPDPQEGAEIRNKKAFRSLSLSVSLESLLFSASVLVFSFLHVDLTCSFVWLCMVTIYLPLSFIV